MPELNKKAAYDFYKQNVYNERLQKLLINYHLSTAGSVPSVVWELFGAILTGDMGKGGYGSDLEKHEIKSAKGNGSFEYQYHLNTGQQKLAEDAKVNHLFISYSADYKNIDVRMLPGRLLTEIFDTWLPELIENYKGPQRKLRFRKGISSSFVKENGRLVMQIQNGDLIR